MDCLRNAPHDSAAAQDGAPHNVRGSRDTLGRAEIRGGSKIVPARPNAARWAVQRRAAENQLIGATTPAEGQVNRATRANPSLIRGFLRHHRCSNRWQVFCLAKYGSIGYTASTLPVNLTTPCV